jgi:hypothetical protein
MTPNLIDHLREQGYEPQEFHFHGDCDQYDLAVSGIGMVSVCLFPQDGHRAEVHLFDAYMHELWTANLSSGTPDAVIIAVADAAAWQLAVMRGGPVTPAQGARI